jgi:hypothetical protein
MAVVVVVAEAAEAEVVLLAEAVEVLLAVVLALREQLLLHVVVDLAAVAVHSVAIAADWAEPVPLVDIVVAWLVRQL